MKADTVSTLSANEIMRTTMARNQTRLNQTLQEFSTGRHADVGRTLGTRTGAVLDMRHIMGDLTGLKSTNAVVGGRLEDAQASIDGIRKLTAGLVDTALSVRQSGAEPALLVADAKSRFGSIFDMLSVTTNGTYVFSGTNASVPPVDKYLSEPPGPARTAVIAAFTTEFGFPPDDPQVATITPAQYQAYLDGPFAALFEEPSWSANFSNATDQVMRDRISAREEVNSSVTANDSGIRKMFYAMALAIDGGIEHMSADTRELASGRIVATASSATYDMVRQQSEIGMVQERLAQANERIDLEAQALQRRVSGAEEVDAFEVAERLGLMMSRIEASYSVTARMQKLSLLNYL